MFNFAEWSDWTWVLLAWGQLLLAYGGYLWYLRWREQRLQDKDKS